MKPSEIISGVRFGRLVTIEPVEGKRSSWSCKCDCGKVKVALSGNLIYGGTKSCGCLKSEVTTSRNTTHGLRYTSAYGRWNMMVQRCYNPSDKGFKYYGARGIHVCDRWMVFENFFADMGHPPKGLSIERIDNNSGYSPENCIWATRIGQANNRRNNRTITHNGETRTLSQWGRVTGVTGLTIYKRLHRGWSVEKALSGPIT
jgi:hypothetical protein